MCVGVWGGGGGGGVCVGVGGVCGWVGGGYSSYILFASLAFVLSN